MTWYPYVTRVRHDRLPSGSSVRVRESLSDWREVEMDCGGGETILLSRFAWDFPGTPFRPLGLVSYLDEVAMRDMARATDEEFLRTLSSIDG